MQDIQNAISSGSRPILDEKNITELVDLFKSNQDSEDGIDITITALLTSAIHDASPQYTLSQLASAIAQSGASGHLDALNVVPLLLESSNEGVDEILALLGECGSAKEVIITTQEAVERLIAQAEYDDEDNLTTKLFTQLRRAILLYTSSIPRAKQRKRSPSASLRPILNDLRTAMSKLSNDLTREQATQLLQVSCSLIKSIFQWISTQAGFKDDENISKALMRQFLIDTLSCLAALLDTNIAQRQFESMFPRFALRNSAKSETDDTEPCITEVVAISSALSITTNLLLEEKSIGTLILLAHDQSLSSVSPSTLFDNLLPLLMSSIQSNTALSSSLSILLTCFRNLQTSHSDISPDTAIPLSSTLTWLSSSHPDPQMRHLAFRILSMLLSLTPSLVRMQILSEILTDETFPQIRVAGIGLLKEAVLEALLKSTGNPFSSPRLLQNFAPIVFRPDPPDLFSNGNLELNKFIETVEPRRLVECLSLYYVLLMRDQRNVTGIRDKSNVSRVSNDLLGPLDMILERWARVYVADDRADHDHVLMPLSALKTALERVKEAKFKLGLQ